MPRRDDLKKILIIGSGPIVIGQACEFDYSGTQACKALRECGYEVVLVNSNPATIMTDPNTADSTYIEPIHWQYVAKIIENERPDAILPTLGGQTGLNTGMELFRRGILEKYNCEMIGARADVIEKAEDRQLFKEAMQKIGLDVCRSRIVNSMEEARDVLKEIGLPIIIRASFTLGGMGGGIAYNREEFEEKVRKGIELSPINEVLLEESIIGWKEYEMEVMRDKADNVVIICSIENLDPMGVHTGDSITVAPAQTLTDREYQRMRDATIAVMREIGVETGGSNVQFAIHPQTGRMVVVEMNPRVSRSSALASKATGFPIAKIAAKLAVGFTLDEIPNDITRETLACFEPTIDYVVTKVPRWTFEKFPEADPELTVQMKSVGETMAIGRTFKESLQKALRGLEIGHFGLGGGKKDLWDSDHRPTIEEIEGKLATPNDMRIFYLRYAMKAGLSNSEIHDLTKIDPWFLENIRDIVRMEDRLRCHERLDQVSDELLREVKRYGFSDKQIGDWLDVSDMEVRRERKRRGILPTFKQVDTCAAEFEAYTPYYYSTYESEDEAPGPRTDGRQRVIILGGGPNRIGQGIEFDYCCCQASFALRELGIESVMVNSNPETVSTDYDTSDLLFFEPLTTEDVLNICDRLQPDGVIVQFGGQTPLNLARGLEQAGVKIIGTSPSMIDAAEDREIFKGILDKLGLHQPPNGMATDAARAVQIASEIGYPVLVRPSFVLGGRAMQICYDERMVREYMTEAVNVSPDRPVLIDKFLEDAVEVDVDAISDGEITVVGGVMEHIEEAGVHSGDSACVLPPYSLPDAIVDEIKTATYALAKELQVRGLMNIQFAVKHQGGEPVVYVLEVNPRASRTSPFVSKATNVPLPKLAAKIMVGKTLKELGFTKEVVPPYVSVKESVFPFTRFAGVDIILGPEMKSTGEVMGIDSTFPAAYARSQLGAGNKLPSSGAVFISLAGRHKEHIISSARRLIDMGFKILATSGTSRVLREAGIEVETVRKLQEGRPNLLDYMANNQVQLVFNTPSGKGARSDEGRIRAAAVMNGIPCVTTLPGCIAVVQALESIQESPEPSVTSLQQWIAQLPASKA
ncbi:carbamoyl-phosphate synthase, large subunit [Planctopirus limnophila DSM 3776]|uniref:Carbamoyl phosphate synthase large chain n=1 Tax=Planctopirus limnophila (strain ATCC 43296 / DSM 3776 / IFAM 1008 / Mu 290) TaxID=521674 RepID=D5SP30_PLAL2|nr:carbamoyl-phosphate synthase large subunit [Planctopirus limnophila]ADG66185.1 carbamoyl-phosphate synthase, large subunit [Planctopirus limnophila DSM 3776]